MNDPVTDRRPRKRLATRQTISDVATRLFMERGFDRVTNRHDGCWRKAARALYQTAEMLTHHSLDMLRRRTGLTKAR